MKRSNPMVFRGCLIAILLLGRWGHAEGIEDAEDRRDPFQPSFMLNHEARHAGFFEHNRSKEVLETYLLDSLSMIGTLERDGVFSVLLKDNAGSIHRAMVGNYLGKNSGQIKNITESEIRVVEWRLDEKQGVRQQEMTIPLTAVQTTSNGG